MSVYDWYEFSDNPRQRRLRLRRTRDGEIRMQFRNPESYDVGNLWTNATEEEIRFLMETFEQLDQTIGEEKLQEHARRLGRTNT
jgi:hypothetical protein